MPLALLLAAALSLAACGTRGSLTLPPGPAPQPILDQLLSGKQGAAAAPVAPAKKAADVSTAPKTETRAAK